MRVSLLRNIEVSVARGIRSYGIVGARAFTARRGTWFADSQEMEGVCRDVWLSIGVLWVLNREQLRRAAWEKRSSGRARDLGADMVIGKSQEGDRAEGVKEEAQGKRARL